MRFLIYKLADQTLAFADWEGFSEMALPGQWPAGLLRYVSRLVMTTGLDDRIWPLPYIALALALAAAFHSLLPRCAKRRWMKLLTIPAALAFGAFMVAAPVLGVGTAIWADMEPSFPVMNPLGLLTAYAMWRVAKRLNPVAAGAMCAVLWVPFGAYALLAGVAAAAANIVKRPFQAIAAAILLAAAPPAAARWVWDDLDTRMSLEMSHAWRFDFAPTSRLIPQLAMEKAIHRGDFEKVVEIAGAMDKARIRPMRMAVAYRILAQWRTGRLPEELFAMELPSSHLTGQSHERSMDGYLVLFHYGLMHPLRQAVHETASHKTWQPPHFRYLGDAAFVTGEWRLARKKYRQLLRCPFRKEFARKRLEALAKRELPEDLKPLARMQETWLALSREPDSLFMAYPASSSHEQIEMLVYRLYSQLPDMPDIPDDMHKMALSAMLLNSDFPHILADIDGIDRLYPEGTWPRPLQEAVFEALNMASPEVQQGIVAHLRPDAAEKDTLASYTAFQKSAFDKKAAFPFKKTFWYYHYFVQPFGPGRKKP